MGDPVEPGFTADADRDASGARPPASGRPVEDAPVDVLVEVLDTTTDLVGIVGPDGRFRYLNQATRRFFGLAPDVPAGEVDAGALLAPGDRDVTLAAWAEAIAAGRLWEGEVRFSRHDGTDVVHSQVVIPHLGPDGELAYVSSVARDVSERIRFTEQLEHLAAHDVLTGLANRRLFLERLEQAIARVERHRDEVAVLFLDLDRFKSVNDRLGHSAGDELLVQLAERLRHVFRIEDVIARLGGDEFVVLCEALPRGGDVGGLGRRVVEVVSRPYELSAGEAVVEVSVGVVTTGPGAGSPDRVLHTADTAMYRAKARGGSEVEAVSLPPGY